MLKFIVPDEVLGLSAFSAAWPSEKEEDMRLRKHGLRIRLVLCYSKSTV